MREFINILIAIITNVPNNNIVDSYLNMIPDLSFDDLDCETWDAIGFEGLDEEMEAYDMDDWEMAHLPISNDDKQKILMFDCETFERFNDFDIKLNEKFNGLINCLIDYDNGVVMLVRVKE